EVPRVARLPDRGLALVPPDGGDPRRAARLRAHPGHGEAHRMSRAVRRHALTAYGVLASAYLLLPIPFVFLFSFNHPEGRFNYVWSGFTLDNWRNWDGPVGIRDALVTSLEVALLATLVATGLSTL